jgi:transposase
MQIPQAEQLGQAITSLRPRQMGAIPLVYPILADLGVRQITNDLVPSEADIDMGRVVMLLTLNRLLAPQPLYHVRDWLAETVLPQVLDISPQKAYDNRLGRALDRLYPYLGELWARLVSRAIRVYDLDLNVLHWDITSIYFEGAYTDSELAAYGYSRDHRSDTKQVNLEVDVTHDGYVPILYHTLPGNTADIIRPLPHLRALLRFFARPELADRRLRPLLVSDCKMVIPEAVLACHGHDLFYLGPLPHGTATEAVLKRVTAEELAAHPLAYRPQRVKPDDPNFVPYQGVWRPFTFEHEGERVTDRVLVVWSAGKQRLDEQKRKTALKRLLNKLADIRKKLNTRRYKKRAYVEQRLLAIQEGNSAKGLVDIQLSGEDGALQLTFRINRRRLAEIQALDGRYALATNAHHLEASEALTLFKGQDGVEKRIRVVKGPLLVRPLFVRTDRRVEGLVFITLLALLVRAILERACRKLRLQVTAEKLFRGFASLQAVDLRWVDGSLQRRASEMTTFQAEVLNTLGWPIAEVYARLSPLER